MFLTSMTETINLCININTLLYKRKTKYNTFVKKFYFNNIFPINLSFKLIVPTPNFDMII